MNADEMVDEYVRTTPSSLGRPYSLRWRKMLRRWWMAGWRGETHGYPPFGTNFEAPCRSAYHEGLKARKGSRL